MDPRPGPGAARVAFAGGEGAFNVVSVLDAAHSAGAGFLQYFDTGGARALRLVSREVCAAVARFPWADKETRVRRPREWRSCFPRARGANISGVRSIVDADFVHLRVIYTLNMSGCDQPSITDAAFAHLRGIHTLYMDGCNQPSITDAAFAHLRGIRALDMSGCRTITDAAFAHLRGIHTLDMSGCRQPTITDAERLCTCAAYTRWT